VGSGGVQRALDQRPVGAGQVRAFAQDLAEGAAIAVFLFPMLLVVAFVFLRVARRTEVV